MATVQGIYVALFGRPADPEGLAFWNAETNDGQDLTGLIGRLTAEPEAVARFQGLTNDEIINSIYQALFNRDADPEGLATFKAALEDGSQTLETIAINILDGAQGSDLTIVNNKIAAADAFTAALDTPEEIAAYAGEEAAAAGRTFLDPVSEDEATVPNAEATQLAINPLLSPDAGLAPAAGGGGAPANAAPVFDDDAINIALASELDGPRLPFDAKLGQDSQLTVLIPDDLSTFVSDAEDTLTLSNISFGDVMIGDTTFSAEDAGFSISDGEFLFSLDGAPDEVRDFYASLDAENFDAALTIIVTDSGGATDERVINLPFTAAVNDAPTFLGAASRNFQENREGIVTTIVATDPEGGPVTFSFGPAEEAPDNSLFTLDSETGALAFITAPDFENPMAEDRSNSYKVGLSATDLAGNKSTTTITVNVTDVNEAPEINGTAIETFLNGFLVEPPFGGNGIPLDTSIDLDLQSVLQNSPGASLTDFVDDVDAGDTIGFDDITLGGVTITDANEVVVFTTDEALGAGFNLNASRFTFEDGGVTEDGSGWYAFLDTLSGGEQLSVELTIVATDNGGLAGETTITLPFVGVDYSGTEFS